MAVLQIEITTASAVSNSSIQGSPFNNRFLAEKTQLVNYCENPFLESPHLRFPNYTHRFFSDEPTNWFRRYAERIWGEFFILARRNLGKLPANLSANFDGEFR